MFDFEKYDKQDRKLRLYRLDKLTQALVLLTGVELFQEQVLEHDLEKLKCDVIAAKTRISGNSNQ